MDGQRGNGETGFSPEIRAVETEVRELLAEFESQRQRLLDQRQEAWEAWLTNRFTDTPHEQAVSEAAVTDEYPATPDRKRAVNSLLGFTPEYPQSCVRLTAEIEQREEMRAEARHRLHQLYRDVLIEWANRQDGMKPVSITHPEATQQVIDARFKVGRRELKVESELGDTASEDRVVGALRTNNLTPSSFDSPKVRSEPERSSDGLAFAISGSVSNDNLSFTIDGQFLDGFSVLADIVECFGLHFRGNIGDENPIG